MAKVSGGGIVCAVGQGGVDGGASVQEHQSGGRVFAVQWCRRGAVSKLRAIRFAGNDVETVKVGRREGEQEERGGNRKEEGRREKRDRGC